MNKNIMGSILIIAASFFFATQAVFARHIKSDIMTMLAYTEAIFIFLIVIAILFKDKSLFVPPKNLSWVLISGIVLAFTMLTYLTAFRLTTFANAIFMHYTAPVFALVIAVVALKERFEWQTLAAILISLAGIFLLAGGYRFSSEHLTGIAVALLSGLLFAILINITKAIAGEMNYLTYMFYQAIPVFIIFSPLLLNAVPDANDLMLIGALAALVYIPGEIFFLAGTRRLKAQHVGMIAYSEILFVILFGWLFFREMPGNLVWLGGTLIVAAGAWIIKKESHQAR
ncbi:DMT family transporter [Candidatus Woesearchaeota archaeon]|nr:DMT family transporter [Candidatus Woesearchaeota archaeon]